MAEKFETFRERFSEEFMELLPKSHRETVTKSADALARGFGPNLNLLSELEVEELAVKRARKSAASFTNSIWQVKSPADEELFNQRIGVGGTPLQLYAQDNDAEGVTTCLAAKVPVNEKDSEGNTALHYLVRDKNKDVDEVSDLLLEAGASLAETNNAGVTPLHQALGITYSDFPPFIKWMDNHHDDFQKAADVKRGGLRPIDMVIARGDVEVEDAMYDQGFALDGPLVTLGEGEQLSVPQILARATVYDDPNIQGEVEESYLRVYEDFPELRSTMEFTALKAMGNRRDDKAMRLVMINDDSPGKVTTGSGFGAYNPKNDIVALGAKRSPEQFRGTLIHEFTHYAVNKLYENDAQPFARGDEESENSYHTAIKEDSSRDFLCFGEKDTELGTVLTERLGGYSAKPNGRLNLNQEGIVGVPQLLVLQGRYALEGKGNGLLREWEKFRDKATVSVSENPERDKLLKPVTGGKPYPAVNRWFEKRQFGELDKDSEGSSRQQVTPKSLASAIMKEARVLTGNFNDTGRTLHCPMASSRAYKFAEEVSIDPIAEIQTKSKEGVKGYLNAIVNNAGAMTQPGYYTPFVERAEELLELADSLDENEFLGRTKQLSEDSRIAYKDVQVFTRRCNALEGALTRTIERTLTANKLPPDLYPSVLEAFVRRNGSKIERGLELLQKTGEKPEKGEVELLLKGFLKELESDVGETVSTLKTASSRKKEINENFSKIAERRHQRDNGLEMTSTEFAEAIVLEARTRYEKKLPLTTGLPTKVTSSKESDLITRLAKVIEAKNDMSEEAFQRYSTFVLEKVLFQKAERSIITRDQSHVSIARRKKWVLDLGKVEVN